MTIEKRFYKTGLLGWPVKHSVSPAIHNAGFKSLGLAGDYQLYATPPEKLEETVSRLLDEGIDGLNVTIPHKQAVLDLPQVAEVSREVEAIGAANTLTRMADGRLRASNTDIYGSREDLLENGVVLDAETCCFILGTGGSAKALTQVLRDEGVENIWHVSRGKGSTNGVFSYTQLKEQLLSLSPTLIINCTPVGMWPNVDASPWPKNVAIPQKITIYDLIYRPEITLFMKQAAAMGCQNIGGLGMLVRQASLSFEAWTGQRPSHDVMYNAAREALAND